MIDHKYYFCNRKILEEEARQMFVHGTNCLGVMGAGVAVMVRNEFPLAYTAYVNHHKVNGLELGRVQYVYTENRGGIVVANANTQFQTGGERPGDYEAIYKCFEDVKRWAVKNMITEIATVEVGCGLAGCDWDIVEMMLRKLFEADEYITLTVYHAPK